MASVWIPSLLRDLTGGLPEVEIPGRNIRDIIEGLEERYPGMKSRLCDNDRLKPNIAIVIDGTASRRGLHQPVTDNSEVHFVPAIAGGIRLLA